MDTKYIEKTMIVKLRVCKFSTIYYLKSLLLSLKGIQIVLFLFDINLFSISFNIPEETKSLNVIV